MVQYNKEKVRGIFQKFWSDPNNMKRINEGSGERAMSANCRLAQGNAALMSNFITTDADHENVCRELGLPLLKFIEPVIL